MPGMGLNTPGYGSRNRNYTLSVGGSADDVQNRQYAAGWYGGGGAAGGGAGNSASDALAARRIAEAGGTIGGITYNTGGVGATGGYSGGYGNDIASQYQSKIDQANAANISRYNENRGLRRDLYGRVMGSLATGNQQNISDINTRYDATGSQNVQDLIDRGLTASTISSNIRSGNERDRTAAINRENFNYEGAKRSADMALTEGDLGVIERRNDVAPELNSLIALSQAMGNTQGQGGYMPYGNGAGNYGSLGGTGFEALAQMGTGLNNLGNMGAMPQFSGFSHHPSVAATSAAQGANTQAVYGYANANPGYNFNSGYSDPYRGMQNNVGLYGQVLGSMPDYSNYA